MNSRTKSRKTRKAKHGKFLSLELNARFANPKSKPRKWRR